MNPRDRARARTRLYALLSSLVSDGATPAALAVARELPALAALVDVDPDQLAAGHHAALSLAFASAYLSPDGLVGGAEVDHLGAALALAPSASPAFLDGRLLSWLPLHVLAVRSTGETAWIAVTELALELCAAHRAELGGPRTSTGPAAPPLDLDATHTSLRTVAEGLCRPAVSGWMPTGPAIGRLADRAGLPGGFGDRVGRLTGLLYAAADAGRLPAVSDAVRALLLGWAADLDAMEDALSLPLDAWRSRVQTTASVMAHIGEAAG